MAVDGVVVGMFLGVESSYLMGLIIGLPFDNMAKYIAGFLGMDSNYRLVVTGMTVATVTNIAGDLIAVALLGGDMFMLGLATSGGNIINHSFNDGKPHAIDVRILAKKKEIILRIRDDCRPFNPVNYYRIYKHDDNREKNIGLRMVIKMTKSIKYVSTMGTNNLVIKI